MLPGALATPEFPSDNAVKFKDSYKYLKKNPEACQQERRNLFLQTLKERHNAVVDKSRDLEEEDVEELVEEMETEEATTKKKLNKYKHRLMFSEWLVESPPDLEENWLVKLCPHGQRRLVVARKYETYSYNRNGDLIESFKSNLPGGNNLSQRNKITMLECLYCHRFKCYYVIDVLYWGSLSLRKHDTEFRFYWLKSKFDELPELGATSRHNHYQFKLVEHFPAVPSLMNEMLEKTIMSESVLCTCDGLLFYHKESPYVSGYTPLVCWLKPYMLSEMFSVNVPAVYMDKMPKNYTVLKEFLENKIKKRELHKSQKDMDTEDVLETMEF